MQQELIIAIVAGLAVMVGWGSADFFAKKTIDEIGDVVTLVWAHVFGTLILVLVALYQIFVRGQQVMLPSKPLDWAGLVFFGVLQAVVYLFVYKGFGKGQLAVLNPVFASYSGLTAAFSILVFGEVVSGHLILALATIFIGILLLSMDFPALKSKRINFSHIPGLKEVGIATLLAAVWTLGWDKFVGGRDWLAYALFMYAFMTGAVWIISKVQKVSLKVSKQNVWKFLILIGVGETLAYLALSLGYSVTSYTSVIVLVGGAFSLPTIILARIFLKEKVARIQTIGTLVIIAGIIMLSLF